MPDVRLRILGPVEMWDGLRQVPLGPPKQRCLIAALAITPGRPVALETLAHRLWGDDLPGEINNNIRTYVARVRQLLRRDPVGTVNVVRRSDSYILDIDAELIDLWRARSLVERATAAAGSGDDGTAVAGYRAALRLWGPDPFCGLRGAWAERTRVGLRQERLSVLSQYFAAELRLGHHDQLVGPLSAEVSEHPLDESLAGHLMISLHRSHRHADALAVFHRIRSELAEQIGI
ncbi:MAG TPA: AfsR/SARP family transcriptional regulator, partial [Actinoplanes sp.]